MNIPEIQEISDEFINSTSLKTQKNPISLWGTVPNAPAHMGIDKFIFFQRRLIQSQFEHIIILDDCEMLKDEFYSKKIEYYHHLFKISNIDTAKIVLTSNLRNKSGYLDDFKQLCKVAKLNNLRKALKDSKSNPSLEFILNPIYQIVDALHLNIDLAFGAFAQRRVYMQARELCKRLERKVLACCFITLTKDINGDLLMNSTSKTRISLHETKKSLLNKINRIAIHRSIKDTIAWDLFDYSILPYSKGISFDDRKISCAQEIEDLINNGKVLPEMVRQVLFVELSKRLELIEAQFPHTMISWIDTRRFII
ncbi:MAG: hypothetical protein ABIF10_06230 [Candidatus Woesearchaeota archaeon]